MGWETCLLTISALSGHDLIVMEARQGKSVGWMLNRHAAPCRAAPLTLIPVSSASTRIHRAWPLKLFQKSFCQTHHRAMLVCALNDVVSWSVHGRPPKQLTSLMSDHCCSGEYAQSAQPHFSFSCVLPSKSSNPIKIKGLWKTWDNKKGVRM